MAKELRRGQLLNAIAVNVARAQAGLWLARLAEWSDAAEVPITLRRERGQWHVKATVSSTRVISATEESLTVAIAHVLRAISVDRGFSRSKNSDGTR